MRSLSLIIIIFIALSVHAEETIYFKIANGDNYLSFYNYTEAIKHPFVKEIAERTMNHGFTPERVNDEHYRVFVHKGLLWQGKEFTQYDYRPLSLDRFRRVLWVDSLNSILKLEIYDTKDRLMFSAFSFDGAQGKPRIKRSDPKPKGYMGFVNILTERRDGVKKMLFFDGLNSFSVFQFPVGKDGKVVDMRALPLQNTDGKTEQLVVYGNYLYNIRTERFQYTVIGSVPFETMQRFAELIDKEDKEFDRLIQNK